VTDNSDSADPRPSDGAERSRLAAAVRLGGAIGATALRPAAGALSFGLAVERQTRRALARRASETTLAALDAVLASKVAEEAVDRVVASELAERALTNALEGSLVEAAGRDVVRYGVLERVADRLLTDGVVEQMAARVLEGPEMERVVEAALESPAMERLVGRVVESRLVDETVARLLESEDLWILVDEIAHSPAVTDAIAQQSVSFADEVAGRVRARSRNADAWLERKARRALRRKPAPELPPDGFAGQRTP
jgi:hypothetical protein